MQGCLAAGFVRQVGVGTCSQQGLGYLQEARRAEQQRTQLSTSQILKYSSPAYSGSSSVLHLIVTPTPRKPLLNRPPSRPECPPFSINPNTCMQINNKPCVLHLHCR
jgi:hypothetical protein